MIWEYLTDFSNQNSPRYTTQIAHTIGADLPIFGPYFNNPKRLLKVLNLLSRKLKNHQVIFTP